MAKSRNTRGARRQGKRGKLWRDYEEVSRYVLKQIGRRFGLADVEGKQKVLGRKSGRNWEIDAKGVRDEDGAIVLVECRRYTTKRLNQEQMASVAYRVDDTGANGGITVSPLPLQKGAAAVAKASNIQHVELDPESSRERWIARIGKFFTHGIITPVTVNVSVSVETEVIRKRDNEMEQDSV